MLVVEKSKHRPRYCVLRSTTYIPKLSTREDLLRFLCWAVYTNSIYDLSLMMVSNFPGAHRLLPHRLTWFHCTFYVHQLDASGDVPTL